MNLAFSFADIGKQSDDRRERSGEGPIDIRQIHLGSIRRGFQRTQLTRIFRHEVLHPTVERNLIWIDWSVLRIVGLAIVIAGDGNYKAWIILVGFVEVSAVF